MDYQIPEQYRDFVRSTEDFLLDIQGDTDLAADRLSYRLYLDSSLNEKDADNQLELLIETRRKYLELISPALESYFWHNGVFTLTVVVGDQLPCLAGSIVFGDCIDDEWFAVYLLQLISSTFSDVSICTYDNDGQFLLIEAADYIDDWLGPENSTNRVWLRDGKVCVIPLQYSSSSGGGMIANPKEALTILIKEYELLHICHSAQRCIDERTVHVYPAKAIAAMHTTVCLLPKTVAQLLVSNRRVLARSVTNFHNANKEKVRDCSARMAKRIVDMISEPLVAVSIPMTRALYAQLTFKNFYPPRKYHSTMRRVAEAADCRNQSTSTSPSAAESRRFKRSFDIGCRLCCGLDIAYQASEEVAAQGKHKTSFATALADDWDAFLGWAIATHQSARGDSDRFSLNYLRELHNRVATFQMLDSAALEKSTHCMTESEISRYDIFVSDMLCFSGRPFHQYVDAQLLYSVRSASQQNVSCKESIDAAVVDATMDELIHNNLRCDDDDWLYMSPTELDSEMKSRVAQFSARNGTPENLPASTNATAISSAAGVVREFPNKAHALAAEPSLGDSADLNSAKLQSSSAEFSKMQQIVDGMNKFLLEKSDYEGVQNTYTSSPQTEHSDQLIGLSVNTSLLRSMLQQTASVELSSASDSKEAVNAVAMNSQSLIGRDTSASVVTSDGASHCNTKDNDTTESQNSTFLGSGVFLLPSASPSSSDVHKPTNDSDDESDATDSINDRGDETFDDSSDALILEYQRAMDREIFSERCLAETFEWHGGAADGDTTDCNDIDVDLTLMKNLMETQTHGMGLPTAGPIAHMMEHIGIDLPMPPPMNT